MDDASYKDEGRTTGVRAAGRKGKEREIAGRNGKGKAEAQIRTAQAFQKP